MIVNKRKPWIKNHSLKKNDDNYNDNNLCFCYNATSHIDYDQEQKLTMHIHEQNKKTINQKKRKTKGRKVHLEGKLMVARELGFVPTLTTLQHA